MRYHARPVVRNPFANTFADSQLGRRITVAVVLLPLVAVLVSRGGLWSAGLFGAAAGIATREYLRLAVPASGPGGWLTVGVAASVPLLPTLAPGQPAVAACAAAMGLSMVLWTCHLLRGPRAEAPVRIGHMLAAVVFIAGGLFALACLRAGSEGLGWTAAVLIGSWANDTAAFLAGKVAGRHKLMPAVSPGKTWEGFIGGALGGVGASIVGGGVLLPGLTVVHCIVLGLLMGLFGPLGDLSKSMLKRAYHVKDTGRILPGHGGMLDRIDAILFNAPAVLLFRWLAQS
jgi:phosphatidate cytidylyltransferase